MDEATGEFGGDELGAPDTWNFSIQVAKSWEEAFFSKPTPVTRKIALRSAMTLSPDRGGVFDVFLGLVRHGLGGTTLPGNQYVSWIHEADFIRAVEFLIERQDITGAVNLASPIRCRTATSCISFVRHGVHASVCPPQGGCSK
jgi:NAD dependent epimerase/dehydratase family enzyme